MLNLPSWNFRSTKFLPPLGGIHILFCNGKQYGMQALGVDIQTIQSIVGHADTEMTEHYLHVQESIRQSAIQLFSEAFSA